MTVFPIFVMPKELLDPTGSDSNGAPKTNDCNGRAEAIAILKSSNKLTSATRQYLSEGLILGVIAAEDVEMEWYERIIDTNGLGPGQMYEPAHQDVVTTLHVELNLFVNSVNACLSRQGEHPIALSKSWKANVKDTRLANFFIAGYLALCVDRAQKAGRSSADALRYGITYFHGARESIKEIQKKVNITKFNNNQPIPWADVENYINTSGSSKEKKILKYVETVVNGGLTK
jgi:hypothetical protein